MRNHKTHRMSDLLLTVLPRRGVRQLLFAIALAGTGAGIASLSGGIAVPRSQAAAATAPAVAEGEAAMIVLPTVTVYPEPEIPTLETVTVRASDATGVSAPIRARLLPVHAVTSFASTGSAGSGFGMPYYSFGKPLRHGTEE